MSAYYEQRIHYLIADNPPGHVFGTLCGKRGYLREEAMGAYIQGDNNWLVTADPEKVDCVMCLRKLAK